MNLPSEHELFSALEKQPRFVILTKCSLPPNRNKSRSRRACADFCSAFLETSTSQQFLLAGSQKSRESWGVGDWEHRIIFISLPHPPSFWPHGKMFYCRTSRLSCTYKFFTAQLTWHLYLSCPTAGRVWQLMIWKRKGPNPPQVVCVLSVHTGLCPSL